MIENKVETKQEDNRKPRDLSAEMLCIEEDDLANDVLNTI